MNATEYLNSILKAQTLTNDSEERKQLEADRQDVEAILREHYDDGPTIKPGGSTAKGTMIKEAYDLDVICYFGRDDTSAGETLKDIYFDVRNNLQDKYLVHEKPSALRLKSLAPEYYGRDYHIDVVPGRYTDEEASDVYLYRSSGEKSRQKTNLETHISHVKGSGVVDAIRLLKLWRVRNGLGIRHFILELLTIELLAARKKASLSDQLIHVWTEMRNNLEDLIVEDPANPYGNDLSELFNATVKHALSSVSSSTLSMIEISGWESVFGEAEEADSAAKVNLLTAAASAVAMPSKPWSY